MRESCNPSSPAFDLSYWSSRRQSGSTLEGRRFSIRGLGNYEKVTCTQPNFVSFGGLMFRSNYSSKALCQEVKHNVLIVLYTILAYTLSSWCIVMHPVAGIRYPCSCGASEEIYDKILSMKKYKIVIPLSYWSKISRSMHIIRIIKRMCARTGRHYSWIIDL